MATPQCALLGNKSLVEEKQIAALLKPSLVEEESKSTIPHSFNLSEQINTCILNRLQESSMQCDKPCDDDVLKSFNAFPTSPVLEPYTSNDINPIDAEFAHVFNAPVLNLGLQGTNSNPPVGASTYTPSHGKTDHIQDMISSYHGNNQNTFKNKETF